MLREAKTAVCDSECKGGRINIINLLQNPLCNFSKYGFWLASTCVWSYALLCIFFIAHLWSWNKSVQILMTKFSIVLCRKLQRQRKRKTVQWWPHWTPRFVGLKQRFGRDFQSSWNSLRERYKYIYLCPSTPKYNTETMLPHLRVESLFTCLYIV